MNHVVSLQYQDDNSDMLVVVVDVSLPWSVVFVHDKVNHHHTCK